jgi:hypothetical protein
MIRVETQEEWEKKIILELIDKFRSKKWGGVYIALIP